MKVIIIDSITPRAKSLARRIVCACSLSVTVFRLTENAVFRFKLTEDKNDDDFVDDTTLGFNGLVLVHGNDCDIFDLRFPDRQEVSVWYGGHSGNWENYPALKIRGKACEKIHQAIDGGDIPLSDQDIIEILEYAQGLRRADDVSCLHPPPACSLLATLSTCVQVELFRRRDELKEWVKKTQKSGDALPNSIREFDSAVTHTEFGLPAPMGWKDVPASFGRDPRLLLKQEAGNVCDSMRITGTDKDRVLTRIERFISSCATDSGPSLDELIGMYVELCWLEQQGRRQ